MTQLFPDTWTPIRSESADGQDPDPCWFVCKDDMTHDTYYRSEQEAQEVADMLNKEDSAESIANNVRDLMLTYADETCGDAADMVARRVAHLLGGAA